MKKLNSGFLLLFFCLISFFAGAQTNPDFYILADKAVKKAYQNPDESINFCQSLILNDKNYEHQLILRHIVAQAYAMKGDYLQSVKASLEKIDSENPYISPFSQVFMDYSLAEQYQNLGLFHQSQRILNTTLSHILEKKIENPQTRITVAKLYQLQAINSGILKDYARAENQLSESDRNLSDKNNENQIIRFENSVFRSIYLTNQNKTDEAKIVLEKTVSELENSDYPFLSAFAYEHLARIYFLKNDYSQCASYLQKALSKIENRGYLPMESKLYEHLGKVSFAMKNMEEYRKYQHLNTQTKNLADANKKDGIRYIVKLVENYETKNLEFYNASEKKKFYTAASIISVLILGLLVYLLIQNSKEKSLKKQLDFFAKLKETSKKNTAVFIERQNQSEENVLPETEKELKKPVLLSKEKELEILQKLDEMEHSDRFLSKNMSLATLAAQLDTNTKYLSEVINTYKGKNFNSYINELRINHIAYLLKTNPAYLNYKVSYLAEVSGFSSHSAFTTVFKSITGMSPHTFIQQINNQKVV